MEKSIAQYQKAFNNIIERLKSNDSVLAVMVFGSMVTGDLWDESDIDLFVILDKKNPDIENIYTEEKEVPVHIKLMSKSKFLQIYEEDLKGGFIHRILASSRLVFSKDIQITTKYDNGRYYPDLDREIWNMVYLGSLLKSLGVCKKYLHNDSIYTSYIAAVRCVEEYARLYVNFSGYMISKDAVTMAINLNDDFKKCVDQLFFNKANKEETINHILEYLQKNVDGSLRNLSNVLINYMREKDSFLSAENIKNDKLFYNYDINMEEILDKLWRKNLIKRENRDYKNEKGEILFKENVYFI
ncbi:nucleotidyltransferase [Clostridium carboxidivorans P7]|uniref:DNA polymerase beta domain protein region n=1 Tax=Clostridium carboxidivorans P7 TaxID=536227 RepID=C6PXP0_9CLOT|nr:nucleotidyltransferase domain-containing protein [Clostridium carboxidivorans]AKN32491.1 nucleotidyltransferase [Clostridium carboxidivorans P7]EET85967.1 DNA polymerase beta domain protein region [Clostridium carboxidivorans P7]EFG87628.1 nucleotidyltransferase domain protein [Clostridium carboxidivorans P7]